MEAIKAQIAQVTAEIDKVKEAISRTEISLLGELSEDDKTFHRGTLGRLQEEKNKLREEKNKLREKENILLQQQQKQQQQQQRPYALQLPLQRVDDVDVSCCKLDKTFLKKNKLESYAMAAELCAIEEDVVDMLESLQKVYEFRTELDKNLAAPFSCIIASSGTGKTQLAATAAFAPENSDATTQPSVFYCYTGASDKGSAQAFYKPHHQLWLLIKNAVQSFRSKAVAGDSDFRVTVNEGKYGANDILDTVLIPQSADYSCDLFCLLNKILFGDDNIQGVTIRFLREKVYASNSSPLFFLDEIPSLVKSPELFMNAVVLRDVLRAIGICPILMSTHTGAHNAVPSGQDSRSDNEGDLWCRMFFRLPSFHTKDTTYEANPWLSRTERPLVARLIIDFNGKRNLTDLVQHIRKELQNRKTDAWTETPVFQLCQLFRTKAAKDDAYSDSHLLVGQHFGHLIVRGASEEDTFVDVKREEAKSWIKKCRVRMVEPRTEQILFMALTVWKMDDLAGTSILFPLVNKKEEPISIRKAFEDSHEFARLIYTQNSNAMSVDGNDLEVLALASVSLASLQFVKNLFEGVALAHYIATVSHLMKRNALQDGALAETSRKVAAALAGSPFLEINVPSFPCTESFFDCSGWDESREYNVGQLKRPANAEQRDGVVTSEKGSEKVLHIECKNLKNGLTKTIMEAIVKRMQEPFRVSFIFTSRLGGIWQEEDSWEKFTRDVCLCNAHVLCFLVLSPERDPYWMDVERGNVKLQYIHGQSTQLVIIFANGVVAK